MALQRTLAFSLVLVASAATGFELKVRHVAGPAYAIVGDLGGRTYDNHALNNTLGFIVTREGVALIDAGATEQGAALIEQAVARVTDQPIKYVINTGSQDHRWLGNGYFAAKGARIVALQHTVETQRHVAEQHLAQLGPVLKERLGTTRPAFAQAPIAGDKGELVVGGVKMQVLWLGDAHFRGDAVVWLPESRVIYSGDLVYLDRLLGVLPGSDAVAWRATFHRMEALAPLHVIPGHGEPGDLAKAQRHTGAYLDWLVGEVGAAAEAWEPLDEVVARLSTAPAFAGLANFDDLHRGNVSRTYVQFENRR